MHHKRRRAEHQRAGCLHYKPYKRGRQAKFVRLKGLAAATLFLVLGILGRPFGVGADELHQLAGNDRAIATNVTPKLREIGANYFELLKQSQIWINVEPELLEAGPAPVLLNLTIAFPDSQLNQAPNSAAVRAQSRCFPVVFPQCTRQPVLTFRVNNTTIIDLTGPGSTYQFIASCSDLKDTAIAQVPFILLREIAESRNAEVDALGFALRFTADDSAAWRLLIHTVEHGAVVRQR